MQFHKAERKKAKLRLAITGPSGSGKTFSALLLAKGIGGRVAMIDTESGSGELYADNPKIGISYDVMQFSPPYTPARAVEAVQAAHKAGYAVVIFDSLSHVWMGEGGLLEMNDNTAKAMRGNTFAAWSENRPHEKKFLEALTRTDIHIIVTMRTKTEWVVETQQNGKTKPVKIGTKPIQRDGLEYEFTTVFDLSIDGNIASASKDRTDLFKGEFFTPTEGTGKQLLAWLERGADTPPPLDMEAIAFDIATANTMDDLKAVFLAHQSQAEASGKLSALNILTNKRKLELDAMAKASAATAKLSDGQRKAIMAHYSGWDRQKRLDDMSAFQGRKIETFSDLSNADAASFLAALDAERLPQGVE